MAEDMRIVPSSRSAWRLPPLRSGLSETSARRGGVALVDTGVWWTHNDIQPNMWSNTDGTHGYDFIAGDSNPMDEDVAGGTFHGTGVAGVIAALTDNNRAIAGAAQVSVMAMRALGSNGEGSSFNTSQAIRWAADRGADVINLSLGTNDTFGGPTDLQLAIDYAWRRGARVLPLTTNNQIHYLAGTPLASPFVTAAAALLLSLEPSLTNIDLWNILNDTATPIGSRYNTGYGWGEGNYLNAINALARPFISATNPSQVWRSSTFKIGWGVFGPAGLAVSDTHVVWGAAAGLPGNATPVQTGVTGDSFTATGLTIPSGADTMYFKVVATVNGTTYESQERPIGVSNLPEFVQALYDLLASNFLYLAIFILALAAIVAFLPQRRARRARRTTYYARSCAPRIYAPPSGPPPVRPVQPVRPAQLVPVAPAQPGSTAPGMVPGRPAAAPPLAPRAAGG